MIYPDLSPHTGHHGLLTEWIALPQGYALRGGARVHLEHLASTWRDSDMTILLSSEEFSRAGGRGGRVDFRDLRQIFFGYSFQVICVLRDQPGFLQSVYLELSRHGLPARPPLFLQDSVKTGQVDGLWCDYSGLYRQIREAFDPGEIHLIDYLSARRSPGGLSAAIWHRIFPNIDMPDAVKSPIWANASPPVLAVWAAQVVSGWTPPPPALLTAAQEAFALEYEAGRQSLFTRNERHMLKGQAEDWNRALTTLAQGDGISLAITSEDEDPNTIHREDIGQDYWIRLARRLSFACATDAA
ncbi:MAG: hypothetical protein VYA97_02645 [Pseudomonadota bacterium]|nr:hypothetical protein [Pseudomonadota bacterium]